MRKTTLLLLLSLGLGVSTASAQSRNDDRPAGDDEILEGPFSDYGEFDSNEDEAADEKFFQYGRFFGVGIGTGLTTATGNAGKLYQGGFPMIDFRLNYWFDFNFALQMCLQNSRHNYNAPPDGLTDVNLFRLMMQVKYYIDTKNLSAPITFIGPHLIAGGGLYQRTDNITGTGSAATATVETKQAFGMNAGLGFELTLKPKKMYVDIEVLAHFVQFNDQFDPRFKPVGISDRTGTWITTGVALVWTW